MFTFKGKKQKPREEVEISNLGDIVWFNPGEGQDRVPFVLVEIAYNMEWGNQIRLENKDELDKRMLWR